MKWRENLKTFENSFFVYHKKFFLQDINHGGIIEKLTSKELYKICSFDKNICYQIAVAKTSSSLFIKTFHRYLKNQIRTSNRSPISMFLPQHSFTNYF